MWTIVPGLADPAGVSFRSVNYPGPLPAPLRTTRWCSTPTTAPARSPADATFYRAAGFADSGWTSFRSYNFPDRYIRHSSYVLRIDPITERLGRHRQAGRDLPHNLVACSRTMS